jgi:hypothetical protein
MISTKQEKREDFFMETQERCFGGGIASCETSHGYGCIIMF